MTQTMAMHFPQTKQSGKSTGKLSRPASNSSATWTCKSGAGTTKTQQAGAARSQSAPTSLRGPYPARSSTSAKTSLRATAMRSWAAQTCLPRATTSILPRNLPSRTARAIPSGPDALTQALTRGRMRSQVTLLVGRSRVIMALACHAFNQKTIWP